MANTKITNPELFNLGDSTSATQLPVMTTTQRIAMNAVPTLNVDYLVVAGGGGAWMGGGGAGGLLTNVGGTALSLNTATPYNVTVGGGGAGAATYSGTSANGSNSIFDSLTSIGGGFGGQNFGPEGADGGSGGGGAAFADSGNGGLGTSGQGNNGGLGQYISGSGGFYGAGGGGGAGTLGENSNTGTLTAGNGGNGLQNDITGTSTYYAGGGGGGVFGDATGYTSGTGGSGGGGNGAIQPSSSGGAAGSNATASTGGGGGGGSGLIATAGFAGGSGGSGIVILRYPTADVASYTATGLTPTETTVGTNTVLSFTTVGTGTITFTLSTPTGTISTGEMIFNSDTDKVEYFDGTKWYGITYESASPAPSNSVVFLDPSNINSYPGTGNAWIDLSTSGSDATLFNTSFSGTAGTNGYFNMTSLNSNSRLNTTGNSLVGWGNNVTSSLSISIWYYPTQTSGFGYVHSKTKSGGYEYALIDEPLYNRIWFLTWTSSGSLVSGAYINSLPARNSWHNIIVTLEYPQTSNGMKLYINNATGNGTVATGSSVRNYPASSSSLFSIGSRADLGTYSFIGRVSKLSCYNTVLTQTEMADIFNAGSGA
tara:strand:- start:65 stop:1855 length:1791 start_codon:yes stop_codon:yes gene_type:complete